MADQIELLLRQGVLEKVPYLGPSFVSKMFLVKKSHGGWRPIFDLRNLNSGRSTPPLPPTPSLQRRAPTDDVHAIRPLICPVRVCLGAQLGSRATALKRHKSGSVPGRFSGSLPAQEQIVRAGKNDNRFSGFTRLADQLGQKHLKALPGVRFPGNSMEHADRCDKASIQGQKHPNPGPGSCKGSKLYLKEGSESSGTLELCELRNSKRPAPLPSSPTVLDSFSQNRPRQRLRINNQVQNNLTWWKEASSPCSPRHKSKVTHFLTMDAADKGWDAQLNGIYMSGNWSVTQRRWHSNKKEMLAVY
ncbi:uncharacterized protein LOC123264650 [Cotesia glomerata]|uniref:uncharacterized protein LOC123264650 n=1 Tax=Cotesia glomerata TaxID=32391 RepID=UPI001D004FC5|nr:uncharacterized protein LOC123264650 [Cotesia glomerata]